LTRRIAAILMCAVMVLVAAAPLALATHDVVKGPQGPRASAVTWEYTPAGYGMWTGHIVNSGLRSLIVDVADNTSGVPADIMHQRIRFAAYDANPVGEVDTAGVIMAANHVYEITVTPNGPRGSTCTVDDVFKLAVPPEAAITLVSQTLLTVIVSGSSSSDADGTIASYSWTFGDGMSASGMEVAHTYAADGTYTITLTVTDNDGMTDSADLIVIVAGPDQPPVAAFTYTVSGMTVNVNAAASSDDHGIVSYEWNWGDLTTGTGMVASHTYATPPVTSESALSGKAPPGTPHPVFGFTYAADGVTTVPNCDVTIVNVATGEMLTTTSSIDGIYSIDLSELQLGWAVGDTLEVTATAMGGVLIGSSSAPVTDTPAGYDQIDVILLPTGGTATVTITLTVTDTIGQTNSVSQQVTLVW
jgi:chitodextrinase